MTHSNFYTPDDYVLSRVIKYPSLFVSKSFEDAKFKVFDQLLNVLGNGINNDADLIEEVTYAPFDKERALQLLTEEDVYNGYFNRHDHKAKYVALDSERSNYDPSMYWVKIQSIADKSPYPNFKKKYSTIWQTGFKELGPKWIDAAIWFYSKCQELLDDPTLDMYEKFPCNTEKEIAQRIAHWTPALEKAVESDNVIAMYGIPYNDNVYEFLCDRWAYTLSNYHEYIDETLTLLKG
jgi:hypothetical protein